MPLISELKRRRVFTVFAAYLVFGWLLTEVLTAILPTLGAPAWTSRAVILAFALGFVPTIVLSWIYQLTPDGIRRDSQLSGKGDLRVDTRTFDFVAISAVLFLTAAVATLVAQSDVGGNDNDADAISAASVAVLPFVNMSNDKDNEYFSDGLTETLLHMLAQTPGLQVAARTSSFAFKGQNLDVRDIAQTLRVAHILEGSVQRVGDKVRITAQLIRAADGFHVWSSNYDRTIDDIFAIQDEIAAKVGSELSASLLGDNASAPTGGAGTEDFGAYELYMQAIGERATYSYRGLLASESLLKGALAVDPSYLDAKTELASNYLHQYETGLIDADEALTKTLAMTAQVLAERPDNPEALAIRIYIEARTAARQGDPSAVTNAIASLDTLVAHNPSLYQIRALLGHFLQGTGQIDRALTLQLDGLHRDPLNPQILFSLGSLYSGLGQLDKARESLQQSLKIEQRQPNAYVQLAEVSLQSGNGADFVRHSLTAISIDPQDHEIPGFVAMFLYRMGLIEEGDDFRDQVFAIAPTSEIAYHIELTRAIAVGDEVASVASARRAIEDDIEDRKFAYRAAVQHLLRVAVRNNTVAEELAWLDDISPGMLDVDGEALPIKFRSAQIIALEAWYTTLPKDELERRIEKVQGIFAPFGGDRPAGSGVRFMLLALQGRNDEAIDLALDTILPKSVLSNLTWQDSAGMPQYTEIGEDPRFADGLARWQSEYDVQREQVSQFLAELSSGNDADAIDP